VRNDIRNILFSITVSAAFSCSPPKNVSSFAFALEVTNRLDIPRKNVLIQWPPHTLDETVPSFDTKTPGIRVVSNEAEIASEYSSEDGLVIMIDSLKAKETRTLTIYYVSEPRTYRKRTQAELSKKTGGQWKEGKYIGGTFINIDSLRVPPEHKDHSDFLRYEGPGWESELVAYRLYLDQRNAIDVFGKTTNDLVLMGVGQVGAQSYHEMQPWGMDIQKVGNSLGIGTIGIWADTSVMRVEKTDGVICYVRNGTLTSSVLLDHYGWKIPSDTVMLATSLSIDAGSRWTFASHNILDDDYDDDRKLCTGIIKDTHAKLFKSEGNDSTYGYIATYGKQSLNNDNLGLVIVFDHNAFVAFREDANNHVVELLENSNFGTVDYYFAAAWEREPNGITNENEFLQWVERSARELASPVIVHVK